MTRFYRQLTDPRDATGAAASSSSAATDTGTDSADPGADDSHGTDADDTGAAERISEMGGRGGPSEVEKAGAAFLAGLSPEAKNKPWDSVVDDEDDGEGDDAGDDDDDDAGEGDADEDDGDEGDEDEGEEGDEDEQPKKGKNRTAAAESGAAAGADPKALTVVIPGLAERSEKPLELEAPDVETADRLRRAINDGMRKADYDVRNRALKQREEGLADVEAALEANPVAFVLDACTKERKIELARAILVEHYDDLTTDIDELADREKRLEKRIEQNNTAKEDRKQLDDAKARRRYSAAMLVAVADLVPKNTEAAVERRFLKDAERDLIDAINSGEKLQPADVARVLEYRRRQYFTASADAGDSSASSSPRPLSAKAKEIARKAQEARESQNRRKDRIKLKRAATRTGNAGIGANVTRAAAINPAATVEEATAALRKRGLPQSWTP